MKTRLAFFGLFLISVIAFISCGGGGGGDGVAPTGKVNLSNYALSGMVNGVWVSDSGTVYNGLDGDLVLTDSTAGDLAVSKDGQFDFGAILENSTDFDISVKTHPAGQECRVKNGSGTIDGADISNIEVECAPRTNRLELFAEKFVNSMAGDEVSGATATGTVPTINVGYSFGINGISFCSPTDPFAEPAVSPTPPDNIYGCINNASLTATVDNPVAQNVSIQLSVDAVYVDFSFERDGTILCGDGGTVSVPSEGYIEFSNLVLDVSLGLIDSPEGFKYAKTVSVGSSVGYGSSTFDLSGDSCASTYLSLLKPFIMPQVELAVEEGLDLFASDVLIPATPVFSNTPM